MNPRISDEIKNSFFVSSERKVFKGVGHLKLGSLDIDDLFKITPKFDETQASVTGNTEEE